MVEATATNNNNTDDNNNNALDILAKRGVVDVLGERHVVFFAVTSRFLTWLLAFVSFNLLGSFATDADFIELVHHHHHHDSPADATTTSIWDVLVDRFFGMFAHWDGLFNLKIAEFGYAGSGSEKVFAFFPLYPLMMRVGGSAVHAIASRFISIKFRSCLILAGFGTNGLVFLLAAIQLYRLTSFVVARQDPQQRQDKITTLAFAKDSALAFCFNPASVFMSALYTESMFALCVFAGLSRLVRLSSTSGSWIATLWFTIAACCRSNGFLLGIFIAAYAGYEIIDLVRIEIDQRRRSPTTPPPSRSATCALKTPCLIALILVRVIAQLVLICLPMLLFQQYTWHAVCTANAAPKPSYCQTSSSSRIGSGLLVWPPPSTYSDIQHRYWGVGIFAYYQWKQIPNFLLAAPALMISISALITLSVSFVANNRFNNRFSSGCFVFSLAATLHAAITLYGWGLVAIAVTLLHIQVTTRFLSALPVIYWFVASQLCRSKYINANQNKSDLCFFPPSSPSSSPSSSPFLSSVIQWWFVLYFILGPLLFGAFLPWT